MSECKPQAHPARLTPAEEGKAPGSALPSSSVLDLTPIRARWGGNWADTRLSRADAVCDIHALLAEVDRLRDLQTALAALSAQSEYFCSDCSLLTAVSEGRITPRDEGSAPRETAPIADVLRFVESHIEAFVRDGEEYGRGWNAAMHNVRNKLLEVQREAASGGIAPPLDLHAQVNRVTRLEVINDGGRQFTQWNTQIGLSFQDDGRTLKVFVKGHQPLPHRDDPIEASPSSPHAETGQDV